MKILSVDDDRDDREILFSAIQRIDPSIVCVGVDDYKHAALLLENLDSFTPDIIFVDFHMPGMNGIECALRLKQHERSKGIPLVIHSSTEDINEIGKIRELGLALVPKGLEYPALVKTLETLLSSANSQAQSVAASPE
jgi:CheY-like chemotaxis protein